MFGIFSGNPKKFKVTTTRAEYDCDRYAANEVITKFTNGKVTITCENSEGCIASRSITVSDGNTTAELRDGSALVVTTPSTKLSAGLPKGSCRDLMGFFGYNDLALPITNQLLCAQNPNEVQMTLEMRGYSIRP